MSAITHQKNAYDAYICPQCKGSLTYQTNSLCCAGCGLSYPLSDNIPDFLAPTIGQISDPLIHRLDRANPRLFKFAAGLYEGRFWYPFVINLYVGRNTTSLPDLIRRVKAALNIQRGCVLDTACGTATFGRRLASSTISVFGIDATLAMLQKGAEYIRRDGTPNIHLARTRVERLPFPDEFFDFAICSGALHLFSDPLIALKEISRTLKPGARVVGLTFFAGPQGLVRYAWFRELLKKRGTIHLFTLPELEITFTQAGFDQYQPTLIGSGIFFAAQKKASA